jgi:hypothetical protein
VTPDLTPVTTAAGFNSYHASDVPGTLATKVSQSEVVKSKLRPNLRISAMTMLLTTEKFPSKEVAPPLFDRIRRAGKRIVAWANTCADHYAAAAMYGQLSRLSDAELHRRGLSRDMLARDVPQSCDRTAAAELERESPRFQRAF